MKLDAHQHFWQLSRGDYAWPNETVAPIFRDFGAKDLTPLLDECAIDQTVLVQATDTVSETRFLLDLADHNPRIAAVVGWADFLDPDAASEISELGAHPKLRGFRPMLQGIAETDWILQAAVAPALKALEHHGLSFDALIEPRHLQTIATLAQRHPDLVIIIDHMAKPAMKQGRAPDPDWARDLKQAAQNPNVFVKLSGMVTEFDGPWDLPTLRAHFDVALEAFGPERILFGSDWPVSNLRCTYGEWMHAVESLIAPLSRFDQAAILGGTAAHCYRLEGT